MQFLMSPAQQPIVLVEQEDQDDADEDQACRDPRKSPVQPDQFLLILLDEGGPVVMRYGSKLREPAFQRTQKVERLFGCRWILLDLSDQGLGRSEPLLELTEGGVMLGVALKKILEASLVQDLSPAQ